MATCKEPSVVPRSPASGISVQFIIQLPSFPGSSAKRPTHSSRAATLRSPRGFLPRSLLTMRYAERQRPLRVNSAFLLTDETPSTIPTSSSYALTSKRIP